MPGKKKGAIFGAKLKEAINEKGLNPHGVATSAGINPPNLYNVLSGSRAPSKTELVKLAAVEELGLSWDQLRAWADLDELGEEGIERFKRYSLHLAGVIEPSLSPLKIPGPGSKLRHPPTRTEIVLLNAMRELGVWTFIPQEPGFWDRTAIQRLGDWRMMLYVFTRSLTRDAKLEKYRKGRLSKTDRDYGSVRAFSELEKLGPEGIERLKNYAAHEVGLRWVRAAMMAEGTQHPPTNEEYILLEDGDRYDVWPTEFDEPEFWAKPPDERAKVFENLAVDVTRIWRHGPSKEENKYLPPSAAVYSAQTTALETTEQEQAKTEDTKSRENNF